ncbi:MAG: helix-turn-helix domain-containing protein [Candidatus Sericytochromatia bacterium]|uniref:Helix-turn-helix domain-containing protein n=1 Tax=Candidatus Tanganyikabacteria bacterium TaxID=2961651 RepID=A0A937X7D3_9BACT|nr:helix-turn-helix domain-containing protein [Candidatus Tanganyikabacteria bacterium]
MTEFGQYVRRAREHKGWSLREAAKQLRLPHSRLFELENGFSSKTGKPIKPTTDNLDLLARGYDLPIDHLVALA